MTTLDPTSFARLLEHPMPPDPSSRSSGSIATSTMTGSAEQQRPETTTTTTTSRPARLTAQHRRRSAADAQSLSSTSTALASNRRYLMTSRAPPQTAAAGASSSATTAQHRAAQAQAHAANPRGSSTARGVLQQPDGTQLPASATALDDWVMATSSDDEQDSDDDHDGITSRPDAWLDALGTSNGTSASDRDVTTRYRLLDSFLVDMQDRIRLRRLLSQAQAGRQTHLHPPRSTTTSSQQPPSFLSFDDLIGNTSAPARDFQLPGLLGTRPLNPAATESQTAAPQRTTLSRQPSHLKDQQWAEQASRPGSHDTRSRPPLRGRASATGTSVDTLDSSMHDLSSATSLSSFLRPGVVFVGQQTFEAKSVATSRYGATAGSSRHVAYAPLPMFASSDPLRPLEAPTDFPALPSSRTNGLDALLRRPAATRPTSTNQVFASYDNVLRHALRSDMGTISIATVAEDSASAAALEAKRQQWGVKVVIHSVSPNNDQVTGLMHAIGVPASPHDITTHFTGELIDPVVDGLRSRQWSSTVRMSTELEYWARIGPFRGMDTNELAVQAHDFHWLRDKTRGWILMRWKEKEFVNVSPSACSLSIDGFYLVALDRSTGQLEGLYCDPSTPPYQRLSLKPNGFAAPFALGTYTMA
ncbi:hypothetical protein ACM66B_001007 [Microbotryomycetes sp. NB124-2]